MKRDTYPKVTIVVILYNGLKWIEICLRTLLETDYSNYEVVVVDNGSSDEGCAYIEHNFKDIKIIRNKRNLGTAGGNNVGIRYALNNGADYVALMNQDLRVEKNWLSNLIKVAKNNKETGMLSPVQYNYEGSDVDEVFKGSLNGTTFFNDVARGHLQEIYFTDFVIGASFLIKKEVFQKIGLYDPHYIMYCDDDDYCRRAIYRGLKIAIVPNSKVYHNNSLANDRGFTKEGKKKKRSGMTVYLLKRNYLIFLLKNPNQSFFTNLKHAYIWTNWWKFFDEVEPKYTSMGKVFIHLLVFLPVIYWKRFMEKQNACYLNL